MCVRSFRPHASWWHILLSNQEVRVTMKQEERGEAVGESSLLMHNHDSRGRMIVEQGGGESSFTNRYL